VVAASPVTIDGAAGEGGGQILRTALALSMCTGVALRLVNIRARRRNPGLQRQHLAAVQAAAQICAAQVEGANLGSQTLVFTPGAVTAGDYQFDIGTAGSTTLVLQAVLPALLTTAAPSRLTITGGTHNPLAPSFEFVEQCFLPLLARMGARVTLRLLRHGFYPAGGGCIDARITPCARLAPLQLTERGTPGAPAAHALVAHLPLHIAQRELEIVRKELAWDRTRLHATQIDDCAGPGNVLLLVLPSANVTEVVTACGQRGVRAEEVAVEAVAQARRYLAGTAPVGEHLADQLILPLALAAGGEFVTARPSAHTLTNIDVVERFLNVKFSAREEAGERWRITVAKKR
jgi:RNA 3'-terminal phosphate cyclase (ATP)